MPEKTCSTCQCNKVCDHNKYGFENCGNYISDDLLPRAREIFEEIEKNECHDISGKTTMYMLFAEEFAELKKKYTEDENDTRTTD